MIGPAGALSDADRAAFARLRREGGWTPEEARAGLSDVDALTARGLITTLVTDMGPLVLLKHQGAVAAFGRRAPSVNATRAVDLAYQRLSLRNLGWRVLREAHRGRSRDTSRIERYPLVRTPEGEGYLIARLVGGGYSRVALRKTLEWLRGRLLSEGRTLIVLTPSEVRGSRLAAENPHTVRLVRHLPWTVPPAGNPPRGSRSTQRLRGGTPQGAAWGDDLQSDGPVITPGSRQGHALRGVPDLTLEVLSLTRAERVERAREALEKDLVLSGQQLARHYGLRPKDVWNVRFVEDLVTPVHGRPHQEVHTRFYLAGHRLARLNGAQLAHQAGTAELRHQLGVRVDRWEVEERFRPQYQDPDAFFADADGQVVAVEYDSGAYPMVKVRRKLSAFQDRGFAGVVWGVPSATRARHLGALMGPAVRVVRWFE